MFNPRQFIKETFIYGIATIIPRVLNFLLVPLHTQSLPVTDYAENTAFYVYAAFFNVLLTYGMETSFFRFFTDRKQKDRVLGTATISLLITTAFVFVVLFAQAAPVAAFVGMSTYHFTLLLGVLLCDTLVVIPFAHLRASGKANRFTSLKLLNVGLYTGLNLVFLWWIPRTEGLFLQDDPVQYVFIANFVASATVFLFVLPFYFRLSWQWSRPMQRQMLRYGAPIMIAGLAFVVNENLDKLLIRHYIDDATMGAYSGCYKLAVFMTLFVQAFRLGAEPFFFKYAKQKDAPKVYALILKYFVICGCVLLIGVCVFLEPLKELLIRNERYWIAIQIVPIILLANLFFGIYHNLSVWYKITDRTQIGMYISVGGALATIGLNVWLIPSIGFMGAAWATLLTYGAMATVSYLLSRRYYPIPYDMGRLAFYLLTSIGIAGVYIYQFAGSLYLGTLMLFVFLLLSFFLEKNELKQLFANDHSNR
ncbi:MAG: polysaccharide biosynthesis C-terminal domain-containing protein [Flavobacteriaceae bacterium]|nr:polysaccharide biosynthesis C-terminal domain-containing protein [Flavobacteriaceae bacterium]